MSSIKTLSIQILITILILELISFLASQLDLFLVNDTPSFYRKDSSISSNLPSVYETRTENKPWGAWRRENLLSIHETSCFNVINSSNEVGARDDSFLEHNSNSIVLLGDSFAEGIGVDHQNTAQFLLEKKLGKNILNFGMAGNFGPLQEYIIYKDLASKYAHNYVLVFVLPANDFKDNEYKYWQDSISKKLRYRPYYSLSSSPLVPFYPPTAKPSDQLGMYSNATLSLKQKLFNYLASLEHFLVNYTWTSNALRTFHAAIFRQDYTNDSYYLSSTLEEQRNLVAAYRGIVDLAGNKTVSFVVIPAARDIELLSKVDKSLIKSQYWYNELQSLSRASGGFFLDLLSVLPSNPNLLFHTCDGHWSEYGNNWAANEIFKMLNR